MKSRNTSTSTAFRLLIMWVHLFLGCLYLITASLWYIPFPWNIPTTVVCLTITAITGLLTWGQYNAWMGPNRN